MKKLLSTLVVCTFLTAGLGSAEVAKPANHPQARHKAAGKAKAGKKAKRRVQARKAARRANKAKAA